MVNKMPTPYDVIGEKTLSHLVDAFYERVGNHPELAPIFPDDLTETARKQKQFLTQYLGGPSIYTEEHGHPMLRARHLPFPITERRAKAWLSCMSEAMDEVELDDSIREGLFSRLALTAKHMINSEEN
ncbi:globin [Niallia taxi]|uniref:Globin n=1 Tax=Niallia taxi TaxID=2499688 RepID=A0A3S2X6I1_9BACI|nr:globin [Niallia taxi]MCM3215978.1 globin [Niallia taxi]MCT2342760.1 globin [Niallia taxi]MDE5051013.1 globin [Niallia taxi]MDK8639134.1 globin [Niallia taxi]MED3962441.1 globin [Niallia taxi]